MQSMSVFILGLMLFAPAFALPARIVNARQENRSAAGGLEQQFQTILSAQVEPAWVGYAVPAIAGRSSMCCWDSGSSQRDCSGCRLEGKQEGVRGTTDAPKSVKLESPAEIVVLYKVSQRQLEKGRVFSDDCELDFGGLPLFWLNDVKSAESLRWLGSVATDFTENDRVGRRRMDGAVTAIAHHQGPDADRLLETLAAASKPLELRKQ